MNSDQVARRLLEDDDVDPKEYAMSMDPLDVFGQSKEDVAMPAGLSPAGERAWRIIIDAMIDNDCKFTGGCKTFYSPKEWRARREEYGGNSQLIVVYDGSEAKYLFNYDAENYHLIDEMDRRLKKAGLWAEQCTSWYSAIYQRAGEAQ